MKSRAVSIVLDAVISTVVFVGAMVAGSLIAGKLLGYTTDANGMEKINGGGATTVALFTIGIVITFAFAIGFYKLLISRKTTATLEVKNDTE